METICLSEVDRRELSEVASVAAGWALDGPTLEALRRRSVDFASLQEVGRLLQDGLRHEGSVLVKNAPSREDAELAALLGLVAIPVPAGNGDVLFFDITPEASSSTDVSGTASAFPFHTDSTFLSVPHDLLGLACVQNSTSGGESLLVSADDVAEQVSSLAGPDALAALGEPAYPFYLRDPLVGHGVQLVPILSADGDRWRIRYRGEIVTRLMSQVETDEIHRNAVTVLQEALASPKHVAGVKLEPDDLLLLDNRRTLHARTAVGSSDRLLRRTKGYLLSTPSGRIL